MPRLPRKYSPIGIYHIMLRGNAKKDIFIDNQDKGKFLKIILLKRRDGYYKLYAYCILNNHAHLVLRESKELISNSMRRITTSYAAYFNKKYDRVGHVFQDRFKSDAITDDSHLLAVIRYIHNNPEKAGIMGKEEYEWSSYPSYISLNSNNPDIIDVLEMFSGDAQVAINMFKNFSSQDDKKEYLSIDNGKTISKKNIHHFIGNFLKNNGINKIDDLNNKIFVKQRDNLIKELTKNSNLSMRNIAEIMGINRETIRRVSKEPSPWQWHGNGRVSRRW